MQAAAGLQSCAGFPDLDRLGSQRAASDKPQIITLHSLHCTLLFCPPYLADLSFGERARSASILTATQQNIVLPQDDK